MPYNISILQLHPRRLLLIDAIGALLSALLLGVVLVQLQQMIGLPARDLYILGIVAFIFCIYSFACYLRVDDNWSPYLVFIAIANVIYCCITAGVVIYHHERVTGWGKLYFIIEIFIIISLAIIELRIASINKKMNTS